MPTSSSPVAPRARSRVGRWERRIDHLVFALGRVARGPDGRGRARGVLRIFRLAEHVMEFGHDIRRLQPDGLVRYEIARLHARPLPLPGQPPVRRGERVIVVHFDNHTSAALAAAAPTTQALVWQLMRAARKDLQILSALARSGAFPDDVRAIWAETLIYPSLVRLGFHTRPAARTFRTPFARLFLLGLAAIYGRDRLDDLEEGGQRLHLGEAWMGLDELQRHYPGRQ